MNFEKYRTDIIEQIINIVNIPSICHENRTTNKPFGEMIDLCLSKTLNLCENLGFRTYKDPDGYYGYAEVGNGDKYIAILCHLDVVPEGDLSLWITHPFEATEIEGEIVGRGAGDDKGPTIMAIYAVKALMDSDINLNKRIRLIFGTDEETLWRDMVVYNQKEEQPWCALVPDGVFPFSYAEKGLLQIELNRATKENDIIINGGKNFNSVAMDATYKGPLTPKIINLIDQEMQYKLNDDELTIIGVPAHASAPYLGKNAILYLAKILNELGEQNDLIEVLTTVFHFDYDKTSLFDIPIQDESGVISVNVGVLEMDSKQTRIKMDIRIPVTYKKEDIINRIEKRLEQYDFKLSVYAYEAPLYTRLDSRFSQILLETYREHTSDFESKPISSGGATYARVFKHNSVCFGPKLKGIKSYAHEANERINIDCLMKALEIYYHSLIKLNDCDEL